MGGTVTCRAVLQPQVSRALLGLRGPGRGNEDRSVQQPTDSRRGAQCVSSLVTRCIGEFGSAVVRDDDTGRVGVRHRL